MPFRAPPGWPPPPPGWEPEPGWQPDPTWPPAPAGWQFEGAEDTEPAPRPGPGAPTGPPAVRPPAVPASPAAEHHLGYFRRHRLEHRLQEWQDERDRLASCLQLAEHPVTYPAAEGFVLRRGELALAVWTGVGLFETRRQPGSWQGHSTGISVPIGDTGLHWRVGQSRGHLVPGAEVPTIIDQGRVLFSTTRVVFAGGRQTREWAFGKLVAYDQALSGDRAWSNLSMQVTNRQKTSGLCFPAALAEKVECVLALAQILAADDRAARTRLILTYQQQLAAHDQAKPQA